MSQMVMSCFYCSIPIIDWIQAVVAAIAIPEAIVGTIVGCIILFRKNKLAEIEGNKLKILIKPFFKLNAVSIEGSKGGKIIFPVQNIGEIGEIISIKEINNTLTIQNKTMLPITKEKGENYFIVTNALHNENPHHKSYEIEIIYEDGLKNKYNQILKLIKGKQKLLSPVEI